MAILTGNGEAKRSRVSAGALAALVPVVGGFSKDSSNARGEPVTVDSRAPCIITP